MFVDHPSDRTTSHQLFDLRQLLNLEKYLPLQVASYDGQQRAVQFGVKYCELSCVVQVLPVLCFFNLAYPLEGFVRGLSGTCNFRAEVPLPVLELCNVRQRIEFQRRDR